MNRKILIPTMALLLALSTAAPVMAGKGAGAKVVRGEAPFDFWQTYIKDITFYGQPLLDYYDVNEIDAHYVATNRWVCIIYQPEAGMDDSDVRQNLVQNGYVELWSGSVLLDNRSFHCVEKWFDADGDGSDYAGTWYVLHWWEDTVEHCHYRWQIESLYIFEAWCKNGAWTWEISP